MVDGAVLDLLGFYQRDLRESADGRKALAKLGITSPEVVDHFGLGWCSGRALKAASEEQYRHFETLGLASRHREALSGCVVMPVHDENGTLVDLHGLRVYRSQRGSGVRYVNWQEPPRGLIGLAAVKTGGEVILAENAFHALHIRQHGYPNVVALRGAGEIRNAARLLQKHDVVRVFLVTRHDKNRLVPVLEKAGIQVESIVVPSSAVVIPKESLNAVEIAPPPPRAVEVCAMGRTDNRLVFGCGETVYRVESTAAVGLGVKSRVKAEKGEKSFLDKVDLASAAGRRKFAQLPAPKSV